VADNVWRVLGPMVTGAQTHGRSGGAR
jgi:hypothetical protein